MNIVLIALGLFIASGVAALCVSLSDKKRAAAAIGCWGSVVASLVCMIPTAAVLGLRRTLSLTHSWAMPLGSFTVKMDMLSAFFSMIILIMVACAAVYGLGYGKSYERRSYNGSAWLFYNVLAASMIMVCISANGLLFLLSWEIMALSSFFLVAFEYQKNEVRKAAWIYMTATYLGTACLFPMFLLLGAQGGSLDFSAINFHASGRLADVCFVLALVGFGAKAGIMPFHVWLPEAHPAAPTHVSAIMSGVMIKTGIYGLVRILTFVGAPHAWWGIVLLAIGALSGVVGILFALSQHDLKRLLAYSSVENIGVILIGMGIGLLGICSGHDIVAVLGFAGALLHVVNHALFKGLLFMGAGSLFRQTHTLEMDLLGGVLKKMPVTGATFLIGAIAISGLPPFNGFISEFLMYGASLYGIVSQKRELLLPLAFAMGALALIGGLAAACFTKAFGTVFLGNPRSLPHVAAGESSALMTAPMIACAGLCFMIGIAGPIFAGKTSEVIVSIFAVHARGVNDIVYPLLFKVSGFSVAALCFAGMIIFARFMLLRNRTIGKAPTWDCGYTAGTNAMQYTASSFTQPVTDLFAGLLRTKKRLTLPSDYFPAHGELETETLDVSNERLYRPIFAFSKSVLSKFRLIQQGRIQVYVFYLVVVLMTLLFWRLR
jgi:formate hydrogenlyase subunit 3/multisubunit Na+/H+ antiporter MnhD subunit